MGLEGPFAVRAFNDLGVGGAQYAHWANYLKQYIQAAPPTDFPGGQYTADHLLIFLDNGNSWAASGKPETREKRVQEAALHLKVPLRILDGAFQNMVYALPTPLGTWESIDDEINQFHYKKYLLPLITASKMNLFDGREFYAGCRSFLHPTE